MFDDFYCWEWAKCDWSEHFQKRLLVALYAIVNMDRRNYVNVSYYLVCIYTLHFFPLMVYPHPLKRLILFTIGEITRGTREKTLLHLYLWENLNRFSLNFAPTYSEDMIFGCCEEFEVNKQITMYKEEQRVESMWHL